MSLRALVLLAAVAVFTGCATRTLEVPLNGGFDAASPDALMRLRPAWPMDGPDPQHTCRTGSVVAHAPALLWSTHGLPNRTTAR